VATTVYNKRTQEIRSRIERFNKDTPFQVIWGNFDEFCGLRRLSRIQISFARKRLVELRDLFPDEAAQALFEKLETRIERARAKWQKREDDRAAAKVAGTTKRRSKTETPAPAASAPNVDPWEE
jgi:hypothetical protein